MLRSSNGSRVCFKKLFFVCVCAIALKANAQVPTLGSDHYAQKALKQLAKQYLNHDAYEMEFTDLVDTLLQDTEMKIDTTIAHSDTSGLCIRGYHTSFNPFQIPLDSVRTIFAKIFLKDRQTEKVVDTIFRLQTEGIVKSKDKLQNLKACFSKMHKQINGHFNNFSYHKSKMKKQLTGEAYNYYQLPYSWSLLNIT